MIMLIHKIAWVRGEIKLTVEIRGKKSNLCTSIGLEYCNELILKVIEHRKKKSELSTVRKIMQMMCLSIHSCQKSRLTGPKWLICRYIIFPLSFPSSFWWEMGTWYLSNHCIWQNSCFVLKTLSRKKIRKLYQLSCSFLVQSLHKKSWT